MSYCMPVAYEVKVINCGKFIPKQDQPFVGQNIQPILRVIIRHFGVTTNGLKGKTGIKPLPDARCIAWRLLMYYEPMLTQVQLGEIFNRDRTTFVHSANYRFDDLIKFNAKFKKQFNDIAAELIDMVPARKKYESVLINEQKVA